MTDNWVQHALNRTGWQPQRQAIALATLGLVIALIVGALYLSRVAADANTGRLLEELIAQRNSLERRNEQLRAEIASLRSVPRLLARAQELNFIYAPPSNIQWLAIEGYNPGGGETVAPIVEKSPAAPVYDESFGGWLSQQFDNLRSQFENFGKSEEGR